MTTLSYPVTGSNITHSMWAKLFSRQHAGVDSGLTLTLSSVSDDATIATGSVNFKGFQLDVTVAHVLTLAAVGTATVYTIGVMYDPADEADSAGPLSLVGAVKSSLTIPSGGAFLPLYDVTRQPSQTLNLAATVNYRTLRASLLVAPAGTTTPAPDPSGVGPAVLVSRTGVKVQDGGAWFDVQPSLTWTNVTPTAGAVASIGGAMQYRVIYGEVQFRGSVARSDGLAWTVTGGGTVSVVIGSVGSNAFPTAPRGWVQGGTSGQTITFRLSTSGQITMYVPSGTASTLIDGSVYL